MYQVFRNKRLVKSINSNEGGFMEFEAARQALRRYIRQLCNKGKLFRFEFGLWDNISRQPGNYTRMGFTIRKVR